MMILNAKLRRMAFCVASALQRKRMVFFSPSLADFYLQTTRSQMLVITPPRLKTIGHLINYHLATTLGKKKKILKMTL